MAENRRVKVQTQNSVYVVAFINGRRWILSSTNPDHQHIGCECDDPRVGSPLVTLQYQGPDRRLRACISSPIVSIEEDNNAESNS